VGDDAQVLDRLVRENPEAAYAASFMEKLRAETAGSSADSPTDDKS
jgi:hypothetical protein